MTEKDARIVPASRQPVTPEHPASATGSAVAPDYSTESSGEDLGVPTANPVFPGVSAAAAADTDEPTRTATFDDATRFAGGTIDMHREQGDDPYGLTAASGTQHDTTGGVDRDREAGIGAPLTAASSSSATAAGSAMSTQTTTQPPTGARGTGGGATSLGAREPERASTAAAAGRSSAPQRDDRSRGSRPSPPPPPPRRPSGTRNAQEIERDIEATRNHLASTVDEITERVKPANVKARLQERARDLVVDEYGQPRKERLVPAAAVVAGLLLLRIVRARRRRHRRR